MKLFLFIYKYLKLELLVSVCYNYLNNIIVSEIKDVKNVNWYYVIYMIWLILKLYNRNKYLVWIWVSIIIYGKYWNMKEIFIILVMLIDLW